MNQPRYRSPEGFKTALEERIRKEITTTQVSFDRFRQRLIFERFLARVFAELGERAVLKGGVVLELRLLRARTTKDIDLRLLGDPEQLLGQLQQAGRLDLGDFLVFEVTPDNNHPTMEGDGIVYDGRRFRVEAKLSNKRYGNPFGVDAGFGDVLFSAPETLSPRNFLDFAGVLPTQFRVYPRETHIAEKLHAYTLPRTHENSRVKDLPDLALLAQTGPFDANDLRAALTQTFSFRNTHSLPARLPSPPTSWAPFYERMAKADSLPWPLLANVEQASRTFLDHVLAGNTGRWNLSSWVWENTP